MPNCTLYWIPAHIIMDSGGHGEIELNVFIAFPDFSGKLLRKNISAILRENGISGFSRQGKLGSDKRCLKVDLFDCPTCSDQKDSDQICTGSYTELRLHCTVYAYALRPL